MLDGCDEAVGPSLVAFLSSTGGAAARLRRVALRRIETGPCWPQIMAALAGLPLLASLVLTNTGSPPPLSFHSRCPALLAAPVHPLSPSLRAGAQLPLLEELWASFKDIRRFALIGPAPDRHHAPHWAQPFCHLGRADGATVPPGPPLSGDTRDPGPRPAPLPTPSSSASS
ncbi:hypothetical protein PAPYR_10256 [Paratrimastix pyriformis]|uniref:Uncharacterized protein n=1 Tax=Paratrimastix pyriformis TaxID=342808 RepID=A0ABQ8UC46_9EUKA|nr:hypothetical protein PAPYR_10256 [Paratrimastix pyriformis]